MLRLCGFLVSVICLASFRLDARHFLVFFILVAATINTFGFLVASIVFAEYSTMKLN